jgi:hypothetical protein
MSQAENISARRARSARRTGLSADETLCEPDREALLADPARALEEKARGKGSGAHARGEPLAEWFVSVYFDDWHDEIWYPSTATRDPRPATRYRLPASRLPLPASRFPGRVRWHVF